MKEQRQPMSGSDACVAMHAALRKCCDSPITSLVYNLVHVIDVTPAKFDPWRLFGALVADALNKGRLPCDAVGEASETLDKAWHAVVRECPDTRPPDNARPCLYALKSAFRLFSDEDFGAMAAFLDAS